MPDYHQRVSYSIVEWLPIYIWNMFCMDDIWFGLRSGQLIMCMFWRWIRVEWSIKTIFILCYSNNNYDNYYLGSGNSFKYLWMIVSVNRLPLRYMICPFHSLSWICFLWDMGICRMNNCVSFDWIIKLTIALLLNITFSCIVNIWSE